MAWIITNVNIKEVWSHRKQKIIFLKKKKKLEQAFTRVFVKYYLLHLAYDFTIKKKLNFRVQFHMY